MTDSDAMKRCPFCAEQILQAARKCKHCGSMLDGTDSGSNEPSLRGERPFERAWIPEPTPPKPEVDLGWALLGVPVIGAFFLWFWISQLSLLEGANDKFYLLTCGVVTVTAILCAVEASNVGMTTDRHRGTYGPIAWLFLLLLMWVIGYPAYLLKRRHYGLSNLLGLGLVTCTIFVGSFVMVGSALNEQIGRVRGAIGDFDHSAAAYRLTPPISQQARADVTEQSPQVAVTEVKLPPLERTFAKAVANAQARSKVAENDMQRGGVKAKRDKEVCAMLADKSASNWVGKIEEIDSNSDGKGVLFISIADGVSVKTWNNSLSDFSDHTLIEPGSALFSTASAMKVGQLVRFSGYFVEDAGEGECIKEGSLTLRGKVEEPEFIFRFTELEAASADASSVRSAGNRRVPQSAHKSIEATTSTEVPGPARADPQVDDQTGQNREDPAVVAWVGQIAARIQRAWLRPPSAKSGIECTARVTQSRSGNVLSVQVLSCNGDASVRESIESAAYRASPLPLAPDARSFESQIEVTFRPD